VIVGGYHDGLAGIVHGDCVQARFLVASSHSEGEEWWHGYYWDGTEADAAGRLIFRPGRIEERP
jgi:hypothetical protein